MIALLVIGGVLFCAFTAYAACVVSGKCTEDEYRQWLNEVKAVDKWD